MMAQSVQGRSDRSAPAARWVLVGVLAAIAACLVLQAAGSLSRAGAQEPAAAGRYDLLAVAGPISPGTNGLYLLDLQRGTICVYEYLAGSRRLRLVAARTFLYDVQLDDYNNEPPLPRDVRTLVEQHRRLRETPPAATQSTQP